MAVEDSSVAKLKFFVERVKVQRIKENYIISKKLKNFEEIYKRVAREHFYT